MCVKIFLEVLNMSLIRKPHQTARLCTTVSASEIVEADRKFKYYTEKQEYKNSEKGQFEQKVRFAIQDVTKEEDKALATLFEATVKLKESIISLIEEYLLKHHDAVEDAEIYEIENALGHLEIAIGKLKKMCKVYQELAKTSSKFLSEYERMFNELIEMDIRFALYAPSRSLNKRNMKFYKLSDELKDRMFDHLMELGVADNASFLDTYANVFKKQIEEKGIEL